MSECINSQQVHHRLGMDKYALLHTEAVFWRTALEFSRLPGQSSAVWRQWRSYAVLLDRREELPPAEAVVDLFAAAKCHWADSQVPFKDSVGWVQSLLTDGRSYLQRELLTYL